VFGGRRSFAARERHGRSEQRSRGGRTDGNAGLGKDAERRALHRRKGVRRQRAKGGRVIQRQAEDRLVRHRGPRDPGV